MVHQERLPICRNGNKEPQMPVLSLALANAEWLFYLVIPNWEKMNA